MDGTPTIGIGGALADTDMAIATDIIEVTGMVIVMDTGTVMSPAEEPDT